MGKQCSYQYQLASLHWRYTLDGKNKWLARGSPGWCKISKQLRNQKYIYSFLCRLWEKPIRQSVSLALILRVECFRNTMTDSEMTTSDDPTFEGKTHWKLSEHKSLRLNCFRTSSNEMRIQCVIHSTVQILSVSESFIIPITMIFSWIFIPLRAIQLQSKTVYRKTWNTSTYVSVRTRIHGY